MTKNQTKPNTGNEALPGVSNETIDKASNGQGKASDGVGVASVDATASNETASNETQPQAVAQPQPQPVASARQDGGHTVAPEQELKPLQVQKIDPEFAHLNIDQIVLNILVDVQDGYDFTFSLYNRTHRFTEPENEFLLRQLVLRKINELINKVR